MHIKTKLVISIGIDGEEEEIKETASDILSRFFEDNNELGECTKCALVRDGDRSALNLLLPKVNGRFEDHYQSRKATLKEVVGENKDAQGMSRICNH